MFCLNASDISLFDCKDATAYDYEVRAPNSQTSRLSLVDRSPFVREPKTRASHVTDQSLKHYACPVVRA